MNRSCYLFLLAFLWAFQNPLSGENASGLVSPSEIARVGLQRMWYTQVEVNSTHGGVKHLTQHVSSTEFITVYQVVTPTGKISFRETDLDKYGKPLGKAQAKKQAEVKLKDMQSLKVDAKAHVQLVPKITLYAVTDSGLIQAIDGETGRTRWKTAVGEAKHPTEAVGVNDQFVCAVNGSELFVMDSKKGEILWQRKTVSSPGAGPALSQNLVFVPMIDGALEAYALNDMQTPPLIFRSHGHAFIQPLYTGSYIAWPTDRGHLYVTSAMSHQINFRLEANDTIVTPATFLPPNKIITSSIDGFIYCLQETAGTLQWRFSTGEPIITTPVPYEDTVYCVTEDKSLFAIDGEVGLERWSTTQMRQVVGASRDRLYCLSDTGRLTILDRRNGNRLGSLSTEFSNLPYLNKETDRIIVGTSSGLLQCFRETQQDFPLVHIVLSKPEAPAARKPVRTAPAAESAKPAANDPFIGGATDPAAPASGDAPKAPLNAPEAKPAPENPF